MIHVSSKVIELHRTKGYIQLTHVKWKIKMYMYFANLLRTASQNIKKFNFLKCT